MYYETAFERDGKALKVVCANQPEMGITTGAVTTMKVIEHFRPKYVIMVSIAAGVAKQDVEQQEYGDVVWNYAAGKFMRQMKSVQTKNANTKVRFKFRTNKWNPDMNRSS